MTMTRASSFGQLARHSLADLAHALDDGALAPPFTAPSVRHFAARADLQGLADELTRLSQKGMAASHIAELIRAVAREREATATAAAQVELVWTGPETHGTASRDTLIVVGELFARARRSVLISGYNVFDGRSVFKKLIDRVAAVPALRVKMFLNILRRNHEAAAPAEKVVERFAADFMRFHWDASRAPEVFYDPRSLDPDAGAVLHAKCVIVDDELALITSANLTEAAQRRNIEAGVLLTNPVIAAQLRAQFEGLVEAGALKPVPGIG